jgi:hypothetical protein
MKRTLGRCKCLLNAAGLRGFKRKTLPQTFEILAGNSIDLVVVGITMGEAEALKALARIKKIRPKLRGVQFHKFPLANTWASAMPPPTKRNGLVPPPPRGAR